MNKLKKDIKHWTVGYLIAAFIFLPIVNYILFLFGVKFFPSFMFNLVFHEIIAFIVYCIFMTGVVFKHIIKN